MEICSSLILQPNHLREYWNGHLLHYKVTEPDCGPSIWDYCLLLILYRKVHMFDYVPTDIGTSNELSALLYYMCVCAGIHVHYCIILQDEIEEKIASSKWLSVVIEGYRMRKHGLGDDPLKREKEGVHLIIAGTETGYICVLNIMNGEIQCSVKVSVFVAFIIQIFICLLSLLELLYSCTKPYPTSQKRSAPVHHIRYDATTVHVCKLYMYIVYCTCVLH